MMEQIKRMKKWTAIFDVTSGMQELLVFFLFMFSRMMWIVIDQKPKWKRNKHNNNNNKKERKVCVTHKK